VLDRLGEVIAQSLKQRESEALPEALEAERARLLRSPVIIAAAVDKPSEPKVVEIENVCATVAALQKLLQALPSQG
jgi:hypothetical protein